MYLLFKKEDQRKLGDATKNVNAVIKIIEKYDITQTNKFAMTAALLFVKEVAVKKDKNWRQNRTTLEKKN